jgi:hypothetical protein
MSAFAYNFLKNLSDGNTDLDTAAFRVVGVDVTQLGAGNGGLITDATNATPIVVTSASHGLANGERVTIGGVGGNTAANGVFKVANVATNTFELTDVITGANVAGNGAYTTGGTWMLVDATMNDLADIPGGARTSDLVEVAAAGMTLAGGQLDIADFDLTGVAGSALVHKFVYYKHDAVEGNAYLIYIDDDDSGIPLTGNGQSIPVTLHANGLVWAYK